MPLQYRNYILMKEVFHCSPQEIDSMPDDELDLYYNIHSEFIQNENKRQKALINKK